MSSIESFLTRNGYKVLCLELVTKGDYSFKDSEWNYSDIPHLNFIHTKVDGITLSSGQRHVSSIFLQKIGPFRLPVSVCILHSEVGLHTYTMTILNILIHVRTVHQGDDVRCLTTTTYAFYYRGFFGMLLSRLARIATRSNYRILMSEDVPMRNQRGMLRQRGITFALDKRDLIGFSDTETIHNNNVEANMLRRSSTICEVKLAALSGEAQIDDFLLQISWEQGIVRIFPSICPHEGAPLKMPFPCDNHPNSSILICPWHGRRLAPLLTLNSNISGTYPLEFCRQKIIIELVSGTEADGLQPKILFTARLPQASTREDKIPNDYSQK